MFQILKLYVMFGSHCDASENWALVCCSFIFYFWFLLRVQELLGLWSRRDLLASRLVGWFTVWCSSCCCFCFGCEEMRRAAMLLHGTVRSVGPPGYDIESLLYLEMGTPMCLEKRLNHELRSLCFRNFTSVDFGTPNCFDCHHHHFFPALTICPAWIPTWQSY